MKFLVLKLTSVCCAALLLAASMATVLAAEELTVNGEAKVNVGDTVKLSLKLADTDENVVGFEMRLFYDADKLEYVKDSLVAEQFDALYVNQDIEGQIPMSWTNVSEPADFSSQAEFFSCDFTVKEGGEAEISFFVIEMFGESFFETNETNPHLRSYTWTYDLSVNGEALITDGVMPISHDSETLENHQSSFINYEDGKGELNSPLQGEDHKAVTGSNAAIEPINVTKDADGGVTPGKLALIIGLPVFAVLIALAIIFVVRSNRKS